MNTRIHQITIANFQRIEGAAVTPRGAVTQVRGKNATGKSSFIGAIEAVLGGEKHRPAKPLRSGAKKGEVSIAFGDYIATLKMNESGNNYLTVTGKDGEPVAGGAQRFLDRLIGPGGLAFDPLAFAETLNPKEQAASLMRAVGLDLAPVEAKRKELYDERTVIGRQREAAKAKVPLALIGDDVPDEVQSAGDLGIRLAEGRQRLQSAEQIRASLNSADGVLAQLRTCQQEITDLTRRLREAEARRDRLIESERAIRCKIEDAEGLAPTPEQVGSLQEQLRNIEALNTRVREKMARKTAEADLKALADQYDELTVTLATIEERKTALIAETELPVKGMAFTEEGITLGGVPFAQASTAQKLRVGVAVALADRPGLRCILIRQGSLLDDEGMAALTELVEAHDAQAFVEVVSNDADLTIVDAA